MSYSHTHTHTKKSRRAGAGVEKSKLPLSRKLYVCCFFCALGVWVWFQLNCSGISCAAPMPPIRLVLPQLALLQPAALCSLVTLPSLIFVHVRYTNSVQSINAAENITNTACSGTTPIGQQQHDKECHHSFVFRFHLLCLDNQQSHEPCDHDNDSLCHLIKMQYIKLAHKAELRKLPQPKLIVCVHAWVSQECTGAWGCVNI